jgi:hypothetical protein
VFQHRFFNFNIRVLLLDFAPAVLFTGNTFYFGSVKIKTMNNEKFTPGPWEKSYILGDKKDFAIAMSAGVMFISRTYENNANLIAAAPDMHEALDGVIAYLKELQNYHDSVDAFHLAIDARINKIQSALNKANPQS